MPLCGVAIRSGTTIYRQIFCPSVIDEPTVFAGPNVIGSNDGQLMVIGNEVSYPFVTRNSSFRHSSLNLCQI